MEPDKKEIIPNDEIGRFVDLFIKVDKEKSDPSDLREVEIMLRDNPRLWHIASGFAGGVFERLVSSMNPGSKADQLIIKAEAEDIKRGLGYYKANQLERLIIDEAILCWAYINHAHAVLKNVMFSAEGLQYSEHKYWQNNLTQCQKRYLKALETLARVRKLNLNIQFNIATNGGKQVNVNSA